MSHQLIRVPVNLAEVHLGEPVTCTPLPSANKAYHYAFET